MGNYRDRFPHVKVKRWREKRQATNQKIYINSFLSTWRWLNSSSGYGFQKPHISSVWIWAVSVWWEDTNPNWIGINSDRRRLVCPAWVACLVQDVRAIYTVNQIQFPYVQCNLGVLQLPRKSDLKQILEERLK